MRVHFRSHKCLSVATLLRVVILRVPVVADIGDFKQKRVEDLARRNHGRVQLRFAFWRNSSLLLGFVFPILLVTTLFVVGASKAGEPKNWMLSGRVALGLSKARAGINATQLEVVDGRAKWKAHVSETPWQYVVIHHSASESGSVEAIHEGHRQRRDSSGSPWLGIGYHFVIGNGKGMKDGAVEATFRWNEQIHGAHSGSVLFNARGIGICLIGNFEKTPPTKAQWQSVQELVKVLAVRHGITREKVVGHASVKATACPGKHFPLKELRAVIPESQS